MFKCSLIGFGRSRGPSGRPGRLVIATALASLILPLGGCGGLGSSTGEGTVDLSRAKEATKSTDTSKAALIRGKGVIGDAQKKGRR
jgi:hypothetical protein